MKILIATSIFPPDIGGPAIYSFKLARELTRRNYKVKVISYADWKRDLPKGVRHLAYFLQVLFSAIPSDVLYAQNATSAGLPSLVAAKVFRRRLVIKIVGDAAWERARETNTLSYRIEFLRKIQGFVARNADCVIVPSFYLKNLIKEWGVNDNKIRVIYNAVSLSEFKYFSGPRIYGDVILSIGRLVPWKGFTELLETMPILLKINPKFKLVIIGSGPLFKDLKSKINDMGLDSSVELAGQIEHENLTAYFKKSAIFVLNSSYEGLSHVILEAMACGTPVIARNVGGNPELIEDGVNGFLVNKNGSYDLADKILELHGDRNLQNKFIANSREKLKLFNFDTMIKETIRVLAG